MSRPSNTAERRLQIVQGLMACMAKLGFEGATIQAIAKEAGLAPGVIHYHFKSKQAILLALVEHIDGLVEGRRQRFAAQAQGPRQELEALIDAYLAPGEGASPQAVAAWAALGTEAIRQREVRAMYQASLKARKERLQALLARLPEGQRHGLEPAAAASGIVALMEGAFQVAAAAPKSLAKGYASQSAKRLLGQGRG